MKGTAKLSLKSDKLPFKIKQNRYSVIELIGSGQFASVYKGIDHENGNRKVAIKIIKEDSLL